MSGLQNFHKQRKEFSQWLNMTGAAWIPVCSPDTEHRGLPDFIVLSVPNIASMQLVSGVAIWMRPWSAYRKAIRDVMVEKFRQHGWRCVVGQDFTGTVERMRMLGYDAKATYQHRELNNECFV